MARRKDEAEQGADDPQSVAGVDQGSGAANQAGTSGTGVVHVQAAPVTRPLPDTAGDESGNVYQRPFGSQPRNIDTETGKTIGLDENTDVGLAASQGGSGAIAVPGTGEYAEQPSTEPPPAQE